MHSTASPFHLFISNKVLISNSKLILSAFSENEKKKNPPSKYCTLKQWKFGIPEITILGTQTVVSSEHN